MKKRFLALFTACTILTTSVINFVLATSDTSQGAGETTTPTESGETTTPSESGETTTPSESGETTTPSESGETTTPSESGETTTPSESGETTTPSESGETTTPSESGEQLVITAEDDEIEIDKNTILTASFIVKSTIEDSTLTYTIVDQPSHGTLVHTDTTKEDFTYTPDLDYVGSDSFTYKASDGTNESNIATITITIKQPAEEIIPFNYIDMQEHWANYSASHLAARGIIIGEEIGSRYYFYPNREITRSDFMLYLLAITESNEDATIEIPNVTFADQDSTPSWLVEAAKLAYAKGIIKGSANGNELYLNPYNTLTRKEAAVMINNILSLTDSTDTLTYKDANTIPAWALQAVKNLTAYKIIQGNDSNEFKPNRIITKAEAAEMCFKLIKQLESEEMPSESGDIK